LASHTISTQKETNVTPTPFISRFALLGLLLAGFPASAQSPDAGAIDGYFRTLSYNPLSLLSVSTPDSTQSMPGKATASNSVIICAPMQKKASLDATSITILSPVGGVVYPGALLKANRNLAEGRPDPVSVYRAPMTLSIDLPGLGTDGTVTVADATNSSVQTSVESMLQKWYPKKLAQQARQSLEAKKASSQEQVSLDLGFSAKWASNSVKSNLSVNTSSKSSTTVALFRQVYYTVTMDIPRSPGSVFGTLVTLADVKGIADANNPTAYVKSVDYGRLIFVKMETNSSETDADLQGSLKYATGGGVTTNSSLQAKYKKIVDNSTFTVLTLGGNAQAATKVFNSSDANALQDLITESATFSEKNPGYPIAYTVNFLKDNQLAQMSFTNDYTEWTCKEYGSGFIKLKHDGGYVAKFSVTWDETDSSGTKKVGKSWSSGEKTAGWSYTLNLPGDATQVRIKALAATGLAWDPWGEIMNLTRSGPTNKTYRAYGTTLDRKYDEQ
jgi:thiol-activated cytolysin